MDTLKQHRYVSLVGPVTWPGIVAAGAAALSAAEYEGWPLAPIARRHPPRARGAARTASGTRAQDAPRR